jgi:cysteine desulfurase
MIYADYNASAPRRPAVKAAVARHFDLCLGNPSSVHAYGRKARALIENARRTLAAALGIFDEHVIVFTSGATEGNNTILREFRGNVLVAAIEHPSVLEVRTDTQRIPATRTGGVDLTALEDLLKQSQGPTLVSVMAANNETGVIQPMAAIAALCQRYKAFYHCDGVQALGRIPLDFPLFDAATFSGHKIGALAGVGFMVVKKSFPYVPYIRGGGQEQSLRAGTENSVGILTMAAALDEALREDWRPTAMLRNRIEARIGEVCPAALLTPPNVDRLPNTTMLHMPGVRGELQVIHFDMAGIALSAGAACSSGKVKASHVLKAMGYGPEEAACAVRISLTPTVTQQEADHIASTWIELFNRHHQGNPVPCVPKGETK